MRQNTSPGFSTQAERIEALLRSRYGEWIPCYAIAELALQYCARINSIRKKLAAAGATEEIENKTEWRDGVCHGAYRICKREGDWYARLHGPRPASHPWKHAVSEKRLAEPDCFQLTSPEPRL